MIKPLKHYAIPEKCKQGTPCPFEGLLDALMPKAYEPRYTELKLETSDKLREDTTGDYTPQGGCIYGNYIYRALVKSDEEYTTLQKINITTGDIELTKTNRSYGHANDMTYNPDDGYLYIAHSSSTRIVYRVNPTNLEYVDTINVPSTIWGIAYNPTDKLYILGNVGSAYLSVYYSDWTFMYRIKMQNQFSGMVRQGVYCDENYIYVSLDNAYGTVEGNEVGSRVMVYTWNGMFIKSVYLPIKEIEWSDVKDGVMYIGTYEGRNADNVKSGVIYEKEFDMYPKQTVITGRPTDVSGGLNNLQRLPEGTPVRLWSGSATAGEIVLNSGVTRLFVDEDGPFRYLRFRFKGANQQVFDWYPANAGVVALREVDITDAESDSNMRIREARLTFRYEDQLFVIDTNKREGFLWDVSEGKLVVTKDAGDITVTDIWGII